MRKTLLLLLVGILVGGVVLSTSPVVFADAGNIVRGDQHFGDIDVGEDYTVTLPTGAANTGGYFANDAWDGQNSLSGGNNLAMLEGDGSTGLLGEGDQLNPYLMGLNTGNVSWFLPCPIEVSGVDNAAGVSQPGSNQDTAAGNAGQVSDAVDTDDYPGCTAMLATGNTEDPQTNDIGLALGSDNASDVTFQQGLFNYVLQNWVDNNVPNVGEVYGVSTGTGVGTWRGTLDQDLATLFQYASGVDAGGGETDMQNGPYLGIEQSLDQGLAYLAGTGLYPGAISDTDIRAEYGNAQRIVQTFALATTAAREDTGGEMIGLGGERFVDSVHQWVAEWMKGTSTRDGSTPGGDSIGGFGEDIASPASVTWDLETLLSSSVLQEGGDASCQTPAGCDGETFIHQVNDQWSTYTADWANGASSQNNPLNPQADLGQGNMVVGHSLGMEFWHAQTSVIPYVAPDISTSGAGEIVFDASGGHDGDHNPLNN